MKLQNSDTPMNGRYLTSADGKNYTAQLVRNETNHITLYRKKGNTTVEEVRFSIRYVAQKADEDHPTIGEHPPTIVTNLDGVTETSNRNFTLTVKATAYTGSPLYASQIEVQMDGKRITGPTGGPVYEYQLYFPDPIVGDTVEHTITVRAWDGEGNSAFVSYRILYRFVDTGDVIGTAYIVIDATTVGLDVMEEPYTYKIRQNTPASYAVIEALEEWGYEYEYSGSMDVGFYLRRISRGGMMDYPAIPENRPLRRAGGCRLHQSRYFAGAGGSAGAGGRLRPDGRELGRGSDSHDPAGAGALSEQHSDVYRNLRGVCDHPGGGAPGAGVAV